MIPMSSLDPPVNGARDHVLGPEGAPITLVEYGSYACPHCRAANETLAALRDRFGERVRYAFRHRPLTDNDLARRSAELAERAPPERFWAVHMELMTRSASLTEADLAAVAAELDLLEPEAEEAVQRAKARVDADEASARANGVRFTPSFFINGRRYDGPWDETSLAEAMQGTLGHRVRVAALEFAQLGAFGRPAPARGDASGAGAVELAAGCGLCGVLGARAGPRARRLALRDVAAPLGQ